jgi:hypothetical protein
MTLPINIRIDRADNGRLRAAWNGPQVIEADTVSELMSQIQSLVVGAIEETAGGEGTTTDDLAGLAELSRSATDQATLLELARASPPPDSWFDEEDV